MRCNDLEDRAGRHYEDLHNGQFGCFFFSSRRRHTRSDRDWSSDVCSSDLGEGAAAATAPAGLSLQVGTPVDVAIIGRAGVYGLHEIGIGGAAERQLQVPGLRQDRKSVV